MRPLLLSLLLLAACCPGLVRCKRKDYVFDLDDGDFATKLQEHETVLVFFYTQWCTNCNRMRPEYIKAAEYLAKHNNPAMAMAQCDCTEGAVETCKRHDIKGFPTLKLFRNGEFVKNYVGSRAAENIIAYMEVEGAPSAFDLKSQTDLETFLQTEEVSIVGFFETDTKLKETFLKIAQSMRGKARLAYTTNEEVLAHERHHNSIVLYRPGFLHSIYEDNTAVYSGREGSEKDIKYFIKVNFHGLVGCRTQDNIQDFSRPLVVAYFNADYVKNPKGTKHWRHKILKVAKQYRNTMHFAISNKEEFWDEIRGFGIDSWKTETPLILATDKRNRKYRMNDLFSRDALDQFVKDMLVGKLEGFTKSEMVPQQNPGPLKITVSNNFDEMVTKPDKDLVLLFYDPNRFDNQEAVTAVEQVAEKMSKEEVLFVKMNAMANDVPNNFKVESLPWILMMKKDDKETHYKYEGAYEVTSLIKFVAKHASNELAGFNKKGVAKTSKSEL